MGRPPLDSEILALLACQKCRGHLSLSGDEKGLVCETCSLVYPLRDGSPVMILEESHPLHGGGRVADSGFSAHGETVSFLIVEGKNKGEKIELEKGICRAIGRSIEDIEKTSIFSVDSVITLDEASKKVVMQYLSKQFQKKPATPAPADGKHETLGHFVRGPDFQIKDGSVSRLHAMIFFDDSGAVGILDLVSRNGTFVNGGEVESRILKKGDLITLGGTKIRFES